MVKYDLKVTKTFKMCVFCTTAKENYYAIYYFQLQKK